MSNNSLINQLKSTILTDNWWKNMCGVEKSEQKENLKKIFTQVQTEEISAEDKKTLLNKKEELEDKIEHLEAKMAVLAEELDKNKESLDKASNEIASIVSGVEDKSSKLAEKQKNWATMVVEDVFHEYKKGTIQGPNGMVSEMERRMRQFSDGGLNSEIDELLANMKSKKSQITELCSVAANLLDQKATLESNYGVTKTTYKFLSSVLDVKKKGTTYTNSNFNTDNPIYSPEKLNTCERLFSNTSYNVQSGTNPSYTEGSTAPTVDSVKEKYKDYLGVEATGDDKFKSTNKAVEALGKAIEGGLLEDLTAAGVRGEDLSKFFAENFANAQIAFDNNGVLKIPYGHDDKAKETFSKLTNYLNGSSLSNDSSTWQSSAFLGALNTWSKDTANTISGNSQIKALSENYSQIFAEMKNGNFTFKEAMYALFNPESGLFKNSGITYKLDEQTGTPSYSIELAGDQETAEAYKNIAKEIYDIWGVKPNRTLDGVQQEEQEAPQTRARDPFTFKSSDGVEYAFVIDRNKDGVLNDVEEFVGASQSSTWQDDLKSLDANNDGVLEGDELNNLGLFGQKYNEATDIQSENTVNVDYHFKTAKDFGIEKIDLNNLGEVNQSTGTHDLNGSEIFKDKFTFVAGGNTVEASRKDDNETFINKVYKDGFGSKLDGNIGFSETYVSDVIEQTYGELDNFSSDYSETIGSMRTLSNFDGVYNSTKSNSEKLISAGSDESKAIIKKGQNRAQSEYNTVSSWEKIKEEITQAAVNAGITVDDEFLQQVKGIYTQFGGSVDEVINQYKKNKEEETLAQAKRNYSKVAYSSIIECSKKGVNATIDQIYDKLISGKARTAEEVAQQLADELGTSEFKFNPESSDLAKYNEKLSANIKEFEEREEEIYTAFNSVFNAAGLSDKVVDALYQLVQEQMASGTYMQNKTGEELANEMLKKFKK